MANGTLSAASTLSNSLLAAASGPDNTVGADIVAFTVTPSNANYGPTGGMTLDLSSIFPNKVLAVFVGPMVKDDDKTIAYDAAYIRAAGGAPATGKLVLYRQTAETAGLKEVAADSVSINGYKCYGFAIGY